MLSVTGAATPLVILMLPFLAGPPPEAVSVLTCVCKARDVVPIVVLAFRFKVVTVISGLVLFGLPPVMKPVLVPSLLRFWMVSDCSPAAGWGLLRTTLSSWLPPSIVTAD